MGKTITIIVQFFSLLGCGLRSSLRSVILPVPSCYAFARSSFHSSLPAARAMSEEKE